MPLFLVRVKRWTRVVQYGDFSIEAADPDQAKTLAKAAIAEGTPIVWEDLDMKNRQPGVTRLEEIEELAAGTEDIREGFG
ncbi:hypothetical protein IVB12_15470 [Bradyrhizobium sp. 179]|uniref:hypothetical protein n=1 Tax=Bradyrhizobium sp. 179 TaxID=2782648 RepID=UPI001FF81239|nr:hypothetical protein [Bradyrhizobium sp. 179]MCK1543314.1 hypothetical protein [Bradyrhizobium sp. 179]